MKTRLLGHPATRRAGVTMIEMMIATVVFSVILGAVGAAVLTGGGAFNADMQTSGVETRARRLIDRIAAEVANAGVATLGGPGPDLFAPGGSSAGALAFIDFAKNEGYAGAVNWGTTSRIALVYDELNDGVDNNSNGLVDECRVVLVRDQGGPNQQTIQWGGFVREYLEGETPDLADENGNGLVDERGLSFDLDPVSDTLTIRLTIECFDLDLQRPLTRTVETAVQMRN